MTGEGQPIPEQDEGLAIAAELGLSELANETMDAHGSTYTVARALAECPPFAQMVRSVASSLPEGLDEDTRSEILKNSVRGMIDQAPTESPEEVKKNSIMS